MLLVFALVPLFLWRRYQDSRSDHAHEDENQVWFFGGSVRVYLFVCFVLKCYCWGYQSVSMKGYRGFYLVVGIFQVPQRETVVRATAGGRRMRRRPATAASSSNAGPSLEGLHQLAFCVYFLSLCPRFSLFSFNCIILLCNSVTQLRWSIWDPTSVGERSEAFCIRMWKPIPRWRWYVTGQSGQYILAVGLDYCKWYQSQTLDGVQWGRWTPKLGGLWDPTSVGEGNETFLIRMWKPLPSRHVTAKSIQNDWRPYTREIVYNLG